MAGRKLFSTEAADGDETSQDGSPLVGNREEAIQRLQVGFFGLASMVLVVGIATAISNRAQVVEARAVPDAAPTTEPTEVAPQSDPLADAGVVPEAPPETPEEDEPAEDEGAAGEGVEVPDIAPTPNSSDRSRGNGAPAE